MSDPRREKIVLLKRFGVCIGAVYIASSVSLGVAACSTVSSDAIKTSQEKFKKCIENASGTTGYERQTLVEICQELLQIRP